METINLQVSKRVYSKLMWLLSQFKSEDVKIVSEKENNHRKYLKDQLSEIDSGNATFLTLDELDALLEKTIIKHDN